MAISNSQLATRVETLLQSWSRRERQYADWLAGTATGGPNGDGRYELTDGTGTTRLVDCPARLADGVSGPTALAQAALHSAEMARDKSVSEATRSAAQAVLAEASRIAGEKARDRSVTAQEASQNHEANALVHRNAAEAAARGATGDRGVTEGLAIQVTEDAAEAVQAALDARAAADRAATFDPAAFAPKTHSHTVAQVTGLQGLLDGKASLSSSANFSADLAAQAILSRSQLVIDAAAGTERAVFLRSASKNRWRITSNAAAENGGNAGSNFAIDRYDDSGARIGTAFAISRNSGATTLGGTLAVSGAVAAFSYAANTSLFYPDGNHTVIKTGAAGAEKYWRFDENGTLYALNGWLYTNHNVQAMGQVIVGDATGGSRTNLEKGWLELRNDNNGYGPYIDLSQNGSADYHARIAFPGRFDLISTTALHLTAQGANNHVRAYSDTGKQNGDVLTEGGSEQRLSKQLTFPSAMNPQDNGASAMLEVLGQGGGYGAWMKFHRPGAYGTYFGMFEDGRWGFGGWSTGATIHEFWTSKNFSPSSRMQRFTDDWVRTSDDYPRFYFAQNGRTYIRGGNGLETRNSRDEWIMQHADDRTTYFAGAVYSDTNFYTGPGHWFRVRGSSGIYWEDYGGGWNMSDSTWLRAYGGKYIYTSTRIRCDDAFYVGEDRQPRFKSGTGAPSGGVDGDIYFQF